MSDFLIKEKFECGIYSLMSVPRILDMDYDAVYVNRNRKYPDEIKSLEDLNWNENKLVTNKLIADSDGEWNCIIGMINRKYFDSREALDKLFVAIDSVDRSREKQFHQISLKQALEYLNVRISCNMDYYLSNKKELEKDLNRQIDNLDLNDEIILKKLEAELFFKQMCELFGEQNEAHNHDETPEMCGDDIIYQNSFIIDEFHVYPEHSDFIYATARRGNFYLLFYYVTS
jgi:hypothetical protein